MNPATNPAHAESEAPTEILPAASELRRPIASREAPRSPAVPTAVPTAVPQPAPPPAAVASTPLIPPAQPPTGEPYVLCEQCRAPVDRDQRYCVRCGTRQTHVANPAITYFAGAAAARRAAGRQPRRPGRAPLYGLFFMVLPLVAAIGIVVGRNNSNNDAAVLAVLRNQKPIVVQTGAAAATPTTGSAAATTAGAGAASSAATPAAKQSAAKAAAAARAPAATTVTKIPAKPSAAALKQGAAIVNSLSKQTGRNYEHTQDNLPPIITIPGSASAGASTPASSSPAGQP